MNIRYLFKVFAMKKIVFLLINSLVFAVAFFPNLLAATSFDRDDDATYSYLTSEDQTRIRVSYEFKFSDLGEDINIKVVNDGNACQHLLTIPCAQGIELGKIYRMDEGYRRDNAKTYLEFTFTIGDHTNNVFNYNTQTQEPIFDSKAKLFLENTNKHLEPKDSLESVRFIIGKIFPDNIGSPLYVSVLCKYGKKGKSQQTVSSPFLIRRKVSLVQTDSCA